MTTSASPHEARCRNRALGDSVEGGSGYVADWGWGGQEEKHRVHTQSQGKDFFSLRKKT